MAQKKSSDWLGPLAIGGVLTALFWLERRYPLRTAKLQPDLQRVPRNFALAAVTAIVIQLCERPLVDSLAHWAARRQQGLLPKLGLSSLPEKILGVVFLDYSLYWWHILLHKMPWLWRCHRVHHTDLVLDTSTALRFHWLEFLASVPWRMAQVALFGIRPPVLALWQRLTFIEVLFHHSNVRLPLRLEQWLGLLVMTPRLHGIHHSVKAEESHTNFSSGLTIWDNLHGTLKSNVPQDAIEIGECSYHTPLELGLKRLLLLPFARAQTARDHAEPSAGKS